MVHRGQRSIESLEYRKARQYCFSNSKFDPELQERIFTKTPDKVTAFVEIAVPWVDEEEIPECPQGLVLSDNHCTGAFQ